jgi:aspartyl-tRNA(Asn)/glutamyl-tRNA(Gln) amidotransferase subunit C
MAALPRKEVEEIALLARLHLEPAELETLENELGAILEHFSAIASVDTTDVAPMTHAVPLDLRMRADEPTPSLSQDDALRNAPMKQGDVFLVPAIISGERE